MPQQKLLDAIIITECACHRATERYPRLNPAPISFFERWKLFQNISGAAFSGPPGLHTLGFQIGRRAAPWGQQIRPAMSISPSANAIQMSSHALSLYDLS